nr:unnamed protein product [Callosobruchus analis]
MKTLKRVVIRGKGGRGVPVLFPSDVQAHIKNLLKHRNLFHSEPNIYLFGNPKTPEPICDNDNGDESDDELCLEETISSPPSQNGQPTTNTIKEKRLLVPWTEEQKSISNGSFLRSHKNKKPPKRKECEQLKEKHHEVLQNKIGSR